MVNSMGLQLSKFTTSNKEHYIKTYEDHNAAVKEYFKDRPNDLLIINITNGELTWENLCPFLNIETCKEGVLPTTNVKRNSSLALVEHEVEEEKEKSTQEAAVGASSNGSGSGSHVPPENSAPDHGQVTVSDGDPGSSDDEYENDTSKGNNNFNAAMITEKEPVSIIRAEEEVAALAVMEMEQEEAVESNHQDHLKERI
eukprot:TRINITY_DN3696_c0_g1_i1.p1 TRINITY_DN3696_c0_g1~~TRINITY_DN3696_c0_g1_i1.p1  ORF type:complete len:199 (+),score=42.90 TRINITY_DN3696_c0_g1_i1:803-1399(+)